MDPLSSEDWWKEVLLALAIISLIGACYGLAWARHLDGCQHVTIHSHGCHRSP